MCEEQRCVDGRRKDRETGRRKAEQVKRQRNNRHKQHMKEIYTEWTMLECDRLALSNIKGGGKWRSGRWVDRDGQVGEVTDR